jgi:Restriction endonuclease NotI
MNSKIIELFTNSTLRPDIDWQNAVTSQNCSYLGRKCIKTRKSQPEIAIGTCTVSF